MKNDISEDIGRYIYSMQLSTINFVSYLPGPGLVVPDDKLPEFTDEVDNRTVVAGREAILSCHVESLGSYKVGVSPQHC